MVGVRLREWERERGSEGGGEERGERGLLGLSWSLTLLTLRPAPPPPERSVRVSLLLTPSLNLLLLLLLVMVVVFDGEEVVVGLAGTRRDQQGKNLKCLRQGGFLDSNSK